MGAKIALLIFSLVKDVHEQDVCGAPIVNQDTPNSVISYLDFSNQSIIVWVKKFVGFIIGEGNRDIVLAGYLCDVFNHVNVFPMWGVPEQSLSGDLVYHVLCRGDHGSLLTELPTSVLGSDAASALQVAFSMAACGALELPKGVDENSNGIH
ncbi:hypothetical protein TIFTF001_033289 [Ficus carica]|uniref:Uncharacterized protein n=1 Tax=Ficus carica TaxID=3494 RepID=A0AA88J7P5_FICCA|nr:hypothetical protein TIFTF001_033289 [Ficus carica]